MRLWVALAAAVALGTAAAWVDASCRPPRAGELDELLYYPSGAFVRQSTLGYETAAADVAWLRAVQYYGEHRLTDQKFDRIDHVMRIVGELDPRFEEPFVFGSFVLAQESKQPDRGLALIRYGLDKNPGAGVSPSRPGSSTTSAATTTRRRPGTSCWPRGAPATRSTPIASRHSRARGPATRRCPSCSGNG